MMSKMMIPAIKHILIFMSYISLSDRAIAGQQYNRLTFHHICLRTLFAPRRNPCAETARLSVLSWRESNLSPRCETLLMFSRMTPTVSSICWRPCQRYSSKHSHRCRFGQVLVALGMTLESLEDGGHSAGSKSHRRIVEVQRRGRSC